MPAAAKHFYNSYKQRFIPKPAVSDKKTKYFLFKDIYPINFIIHTLRMQAKLSRRIFNASMKNHPQAKKSLCTSLLSYHTDKQERAGDNILNKSTLPTLGRSHHDKNTHHMYVHGNRFS